MRLYSLFILALEGNATPQTSTQNPTDQINEYAQSLLNLDPANPYSKQFIQDAARENLTPTANDFSQFSVGIQLFDGCFKDIQQSQVAQVKQQIEQIVVVLYQFYLISNGNLASPLTDEIVPKTWSICSRAFVDFSQDLVYNLESQKVTLKISSGDIIPNQSIMGRWRNMEMFPPNLQSQFKNAWVVMNPFGSVIPKLRGVLNSKLDRLEAKSVKSTSDPVQSEGAQVSQVVPQVQSSSTISRVDRELILKRLLKNSINLGENCEIKKSILEKKTLIGFINVENRHNIEVCAANNATLSADVNRNVMMIGFVNVSTSDDISVVATEIFQMISRIIDSINI